MRPLTHNTQHNTPRDEKNTHTHFIRFTQHNLNIRTLRARQTRANHYTAELHILLYILYILLCIVRACASRLTALCGSGDHVIPLLNNPHIIIERMNERSKRGPCPAQLACCCWLQQWKKRATAQEASKKLISIKHCLLSVCCACVTCVCRDVCIVCVCFSSHRRHTHKHSHTNRHTLRDLCARAARLSAASGCA